MGPISSTQSPLPQPDPATLLTGKRIEKLCSRPAVRMNQLQFAWSNHTHQEEEEGKAYRRMNAVLLTNWHSKVSSTLMLFEGRKVLGLGCGKSVWLGYCLALSVDS